MLRQMIGRKILEERELAALARTFREETGKTQGEAARELGVSRPSIVQAENNPKQSLFKLRKRMIEKNSAFKVVGPAYWLEKK